MSALPQHQPDATHLRALTTRSLNEVMQLEIAVYPFPWTRGNFIDSIAAGHLCWTLHDGAGALLGYCVAMRGVQEMHLLNITIGAAARRHGHARRLLDALLAHAAAAGDSQLWLEVRVGNVEARAAYHRLGFSEVGLRKGYYPAPASGREDAIVMTLPIVPLPSPPPHAGAD